jgi:ABC-type lipoprotein release transport system permease subunit
VGLEPAADRAISDFSSQLVRGRFLEEGGLGEVVIGEMMAVDLELDVGEELLLLGQAADGSMATELLKVVGTFHTGADQMDRSGAYVHLSTLQAALALEGQVHQVLIVGAGLESSAALTEVVSAELSNTEGIQVRSWEEAEPSTAQMLGMRDVGLYIMLFIVFTVAGLAVLNTMLMTVFERTGDLGVLRALGMGRLQMMLLVVLESLLLTAVATLFGLMFGGFLDWLLLEYGFPYETADGKGISWNGVTFPPVIKGAFRIEPVVITVVFMNAVAFFAAVWPAIRAARLRPVEAMRQS